MVYGHVWLSCARASMKSLWNVHCWHVFNLFVCLFVSIISSKLVLGGVYPFTEALCPSPSQCTFTCGLGDSPLVGCLFDSSMGMSCRFAPWGRTGSRPPRVGTILTHRPTLSNRICQLKVRDILPFFLLSPRGVGRLGVGALRNANPLRCVETTHSVNLWVNLIIES